jgi:hypothetical protein
MTAVFTDDSLEHRCAAGHYWREHHNGQVTPSWGLGGTFIDGGDPSRCPEPTTDEHGLYECGSCGERHRPGDGLAGMSFTPWEFGPAGRQECEVPVAACRQPTVWTRRWGDRHLPWPKGPGQLYSLSRLTHGRDGERLVAYVGSTPNHARVIALDTGEPLQIPFGCPDWISAETRKASVAELPDALRKIWPHDPRAGEVGGISTSWILANTNADYVALCELQSQGLIRTPDHEREFMWAILAADGARDGLEREIRQRIQDGRWDATDVSAVIAAHAETVQRVRDQRALAAPGAGAQLRLGF